MRVPFTKAQGAGNDFLFSPESAVPVDNRPELARKICSRHNGVGADGWYLVGPAAGEWDASIHLYNSDGSEAELSGNGTRCAAAMLVHDGFTRDTLRIRTGAGVRELRLLESAGLDYVFDMRMGRPRWEEDEVRTSLALKRGAIEATILNVGNPQCAVFVEAFPEDWAKIGKEIEGHPYFPDRTNVSFVKVTDRHTIEARFFERGAGETMSSGTGSMGAAVAAIIRGEADSPVRVETPAGPLDLRWEEDVFLVGPARIVATGEFFFQRRSGASE